MEEVPKKEITVETFKSTEEAAWGLESCCKALPKAEEMDPGQWWVPE
jgi:hypothetical protein